MILLLGAIYVLMIVLTYLSQRKLLSIGNAPEFYPHRFMIFLMFVPFVGLMVSMLLLLSEVGMHINPINWKKFYRIK